MIKTIQITLLSLAFMLVNTFAYAGIVTSQSSLHFVIKQEGAPVEGSFKSFEGTIHFDAKVPARSAAKLTVDLNSIDFASSETEDEARGKNWFNVKLFPKAQFESTSVKKMDSSHYQIEGLLTIKNIKKPIKIVVNMQQKGNNGEVEGQFTLSRTAFQVGQGVWADPDTVADSVLVKFHMVFIN